jgi:hypothetical protein
LTKLIRTKGFPIQNRESPEGFDSFFKDGFRQDLQSAGLRLHARTWFQHGRRLELSHKIQNGITTLKIINMHVRLRLFRSLYQKNFFAFRFAGFIKIFVTANYI